MGQLVSSEQTADVSVELAQFAAIQTLDSIPSDVVERVKHSLLDSLGCAIYGRPDPSRLLGRPAGAATVIGTTLRTSLLEAAVMNATSIHATGMNEGFPRAQTHPTTAVVPALLAVGERDHLSGAELLAAIAVGYELAVRLGLSLSAILTKERRIFSQTTWGAFGATAALAKVAGMDAAGVGNALGVVACTVPTMLTDALRDNATVKDQFAGSTVASVLRSMELATSGVTGVRDWLGAWTRALVPSAVADGTVLGVVDKLGVYWHLNSGGMRIRTLPVTAMAQPTVAGLHEVLKQRAISPEEVVEVVVESSNRIENGRIYGPASRVGALASIPFLVSALLHERDRFLADPFLLDFITNEQMADPRIRAFQDRVRLVADPVFDHNLERGNPVKFEARVTIAMTSGEKVVAYKDMFGGTGGALSRTDVAAKFAALARRSVDRDRVDEIIATVWDLERLDDVSRVLKLTIPG